MRFLDFVRKELRISRKKTFKWMEHCIPNPGGVEVLLNLNTN